MKIKTAAALGVDRLYHYQSLEKAEHLVRILTEHSLYFSSPREFNDPWDCHPCFSKEVLNSAEGAERTIQWFIRSAKKHAPNLAEKEHARRAQELRANQRLLQSLVDQATTEIGKVISDTYRVYCMTRHPDSTLMWSHYARSHTGVCLEFSVKNALICGAIPVDYFEEFPSLDVADDDLDANLLPLITKSRLWKYEDEYRIIATEHPNVFPDVPVTKDGLLSHPEGALQSIIVGASIKPDDRRLVETLVEKTKGQIRLKEAKAIPEKYQLEIHDVT